MKKIERKKLIDIILSMRELKQSEFDTLFNNSEEFKNIVFIKNKGWKKWIFTKSYKHQELNYKKWNLKKAA